MSQCRRAKQIPASPPSSVYALAWRQMLCSPAITLTFFAAATVHAACHGAVAWCAATLGRSLIIASNDTWHTTSVAAIGLGAVVVKAVAGTLSARLQAQLCGEAGQTVRIAVVEDLLRYGTAASTPTAVAKLTGRVVDLETSINTGVFTAVRAVAQLAPIVAGLLLTSARLTLGALLALSLFGVALSYARHWVRAHQRASMKACDDLHEELDDLVRHADLWRSYGTGNHVLQVIASLGARATAARANADSIRAGLSSSNEILASLALLIAVAVGARWAGIPSASVIVFATLFFMAYRPLRDLGDARVSISQGQIALRDLSSIQAPRPTETDPDASQSLPSAPSILIVDNVCVPGRTPPASFAVQPKTMVVIAGPTGVGKTTLLRALLGLEPASYGRTTYGCKLLGAGQVGPAERPFAWVPQDAPIVSGSLDDNFLLAGANPQVARSQLAALASSDLEQAIAGMKLGQSGRNLSGGERRWVALARALATGLPVLLLDEPTVGLDAQSKARLLAIIDHARKHRTLIIASHDPAVIEMADQVVFLGACQPQSVPQPDPNAGPVARPMRQRRGEADADNAASPS